MHLAVAALGTLMLGTLMLATTPALSAGFARVMVPDPDGPPLEAGIWYPSDAPASSQRLGLYTQTVAAGSAVAGRGLPLVVMSHGTGGSFEGHYDTALALAEAGFVVAAVNPYRRQLPGPEPVPPPRQQAAPHQGSDRLHAGIVAAPRPA